MIVDKIKKLCRQKGIFISDMERDLKLGNGTIGKWAFVNPRSDNLKSVADYLGVSMDFLMSDGE